MGLGKTYSADYLIDSNGNTGVSGQVLISTATGIDWADGSAITGGPYLPLAGGTMTGNTIHNDNVKSIYGTASDGLEIYHDGSHSYISDIGTGDLTIRASNDLRLQSASTEAYLTCNENGSVQIYYNNSERFETTSAGATLSGDLTISNTTPKLIFDNLAGGGLDPSLTASGTNFTLSTSSTTPLSIALDTGDATFAGDLTVSGGDITLGGTGRIQGIDTVSATTDAVNKAYVDAVNVGVTQITAGTNITISPSGGTGNVTINASGGGGSGTIGGTIANQQIPVGTATDTIGGFGYFIYTPQIGLQLGNNSQTGGANNITINRPSGAPGKFIIKEGSTTEFSITTGGNTTISSNTNNLILTDDTTAKVGVGNTSPTEKLDVTGRIKASKGVQVGAEADGDAASGLVGTFRYRTYSDATFVYSAIDVCMQDGAGIGDYNWINVVTNRW